VTYPIDALSQGHGIRDIAYNNQLEDLTASGRIV
jgi:hypothetical protein